MLHLCKRFVDRMLSTWCLMKGAVYCSFCRALQYSHFGKVLLQHFTSTWKKLLTHCIFVDFLLVLVLAQSALRKELFIGPLGERFNIPLWESPTERLCQYQEQFVETSHFCLSFFDTILCLRCSTKGAAHCSFRRAL